MMNFIYSVVIALILDGFNVIASYEELYIDEDNIAEILADGGSTHTTKIEIGSEELLNPHDYSRIVKKYECMKELNLSSIGKIVDFTFLRFSPRRLRNINFSDRVSRHYGLSSAELSASLLASLKLPPVFTSLSNPGSSVTKPMREKTGVGRTFERFPVLEHSMIVPKKRRKARSDGRVKIDSLTDVTHRAQGVVNFRVRSAGKRGSGTLIGKNIVLTAAHNVYDIEREEEHRALQFAAGFDGNEYKYGVQEVEEIYYPTAYAEGDDSEDYALLILDENIGVSTGYLGLSVLGDAELLDKKLHVTGYPGEAEDKSLDYQLCTMSGRTEAELVSDHFVGYNIDTSAGQSGSAVWFKGRDGNDYVAAVHVRASAIGNYNEGVRITKSRLFQINEWIRQYNQTQLGEQYDGWLKATFGAKRARSLYEQCRSSSLLASSLLDQLSGVGSGMSTPVASARSLPDTSSFAGTASSGVGSAAGSPLSTKNPDSSASAAGTPTAEDLERKARLARLRAAKEEKARQKAEEEARRAEEEEIAKLEAELNAEKESEERKKAEVLRIQQEEERKKAEQVRLAEEAEIAKLDAEAKAEEERQEAARRQAQLQEQQRKDESRRALIARLEKVREDFGNNLLGKKGVSVNKERALVLYREAEQLDPENIIVITMRGLLYDIGAPGYEVDKNEAVRIYRIGVSQGNAQAQNNLGIMYSNGEGVIQDKAEEARLYRKAADQGLASAQYNLGLMYSNGEGVIQDKAEAARLYRKAADQGLASAQYNLGLMYDNGEGVAQNKAKAVRWYRKAADQGYASAQFNLGFMYEFGQGVAQNKEEAVCWYRKAADQGLASAQYNLGHMYDNGEGVSQEKAEAVRWYRKAAEQGQSEAQKSLGTMYYMGEGVTEDKKESLRWFRQASDKGHAEAQFNLGVQYEFGQGVAQNKEEAVCWYRKAADQGLASAQSNLGHMYYNGTGVSQEKAEAVRWYRKAAEQGQSEAQKSLGTMYYMGEGVTEDKKESLRWFRQASDKGHAEAQFNLGVQYEFGQGVAQNKEEAVCWYRKAADQGLASAQSNLGHMYYNGTGVSQEKAEAVRWYRKAADQGLASGQSNLGIMYSNGEGVIQDKAEAARLYRKAADQGLASAQYNLGVMYKNGTGVSQDKAEAVRWYRKAAAQGNGFAKSELADMESSKQGVAASAGPAQTEEDDETSSVAVTSSSSSQYGELGYDGSLTVGLYNRGENARKALEDVPVAERARILDAALRYSGGCTCAPQYFIQYLNTLPATQWEEFYLHYKRLCSSKNNKVSEFSTLLGIKSMRYDSFVKFVDFMCNAEEEVFRIINKKYMSDEFKVYRAIQIIPAPSRLEAAKKAVKSVRFVRDNCDNDDKMVKALRKFYP